MKLMDIDADTLNIPETEYDARVTMPASEFTRIVRDLSLLGESVRIEVSKEGVRFVSEGEAANGSVLLRQSDGSHISGTTIKPKTEETSEEAGDGEEAESSSKAKKSKVKKEKGDDEDAEMVDDDEEEPEAEKEEEENGEEEKEDEDEEEEDGSSKKRKRVCAPLDHLRAIV